VKLLTLQNRVQVPQEGAQVHFSCPMWNDEGDAVSGLAVGRVIGAAESQTSVMACRVHDGRWSGIENDFQLSHCEET